MRCFACALSWATWLLFTGVPAQCVACVCGVLGHLALVHRCAHSACCFACAVSWATWLLFTGVPPRCAPLRVRCPEPLGSCSALCPLGALLCMCGVPGHLAPVHQSARSVRCLAYAVSWGTWRLFSSVPARCVGCVCDVLGHRCARVVCCCCVCGVLGLLAPVHQCARSVRCFACAVSLATWLLFGGVPARCVFLRVRCPGPLGSCSPVCPLGALLCVCGVLSHSALVHGCAHAVCCVACAVSWDSWLLFTDVPARCVALLVRCPGALGSWSPVCPLSALPVCAVSWATWLRLTGVPARCVACVCGVLGHLAAVHWFAWLVRSFACAVSPATRLLFTHVPARFVVLRVRCSGPLCSFSPVCPLGVLCCVCGVLGPLALLHRCARPVCCVVSWATWLLFTGVLARCVVLWVACAGRRCGALTRPSRRWLFVAGRGCVPSGRALVHPDGGFFVAGRGWVPSGRALVHPAGGCSYPAAAGYPRGAHAFIRTAAVL